MEIKATLSKPYNEAEKIDFIVVNNHQLGYEIKETETALEAWGADENDLLEQVKKAKIIVNDTARDAALNHGVMYHDVLFDSDTDQKINLMATVELMPEGATVEWYGMDNQPLTCTKEDLYNIGGLIVELHSFCWSKNAQIKNLISEAATIEDVNNIEINYNESEGE